MTEVLSNLSFRYSPGYLPGQVSERFVPRTKDNICPELIEHPHDLVSIINNISRPSPRVYPVCKVFAGYVPCRGPTGIKDGKEYKTVRGPEVIHEHLNIFVLHQSCRPESVWLEYITGRFPQALYRLHERSYLVGVMGIVIDNEMVPVVQIDVEAPVYAVKFRQHPSYSIKRCPGLRKKGYA